MKLDIYELMDCAGVAPESLCERNDAETWRVKSLVNAKIGSGRRKNAPKSLRLALIAAAAVAVLTGAALAANSLGLFEKALGYEAAEKYTESINELALTESAGSLSVTLDSVIYTEDKIYAIISSEAPVDDISAVGRVITAKTGEDIHWLDCVTVPVEGEENTWLLTGTITYPYDVEARLAAMTDEERREQEKLYLAAGDYSSYNSLKDCLGETLELSVTGSGETVELTAAVARLYYEEISVELKESDFGPDFYDTMLITPNEIVLQGTFTSLTPAELWAVETEAETLDSGDALPENYFWYSPEIDLRLVMDDGAELAYKHRNSYAIAGADVSSGYDVDSTMGAGRGGNPDTGEMYAYLSPNGWKIEPKALKSVIINGVVVWEA